MPWRRLPTGARFTPHEAGSLLKPDVDNPLESFCCSKPAIYDKGRATTSSGTTRRGTSTGCGMRKAATGSIFDIDPNVVVDASDSGWDAIMTEYPCIVELPDRDLLYYCGDTFAGIGVAERSK